MEQKNRPAEPCLNSQPTKLRYNKIIVVLSYCYPVSAIPRTSSFFFISIHTPVGESVLVERRNHTELGTRISTSTRRAVFQITAEVEKNFLALRPPRWFWPTCLHTCCSLCLENPSFCICLTSIHLSKPKHPWYPPLILYLLFMASASAFFPPDSNCLFHLCEFPQLMSRGKSAWALHPLPGTVPNKHEGCNLSGGDSKMGG